MKNYIDGVGAEICVQESVKLNANVGITDAFFFEKNPATARPDHQKERNCSNPVSIGSVSFWPLYAFISLGSLTCKSAVEIPKFLKK